MNTRELKEDGATAVPTMSAGSGQIAGIGVGPDGEPGVDTKARKKKWKQDQQKSELHLPKEMISGGLTEGQKPLDIDLWAAAQEMAKDEYPDHPTPDSTKFAIDWYLEHGGEYASNTAKNEAVDSTVVDKPTLTPQEIADKHKVPVSDIEAQLKKGIPVEREHTSSEAATREIALDHLTKVPDYYDKLKKVEEAAEPCWDGYEMVGMKMKDGKRVPNCVPKNEENTPSDREWGTDSLTKIYKQDTPGELEEAVTSSIHQIKNGDRVEGRYMNKFPFTGKVYDQRPHTMNHKIQMFFVHLDKPITVFGERRDSLIIHASDDPYAANHFVGGTGGDSIKLKESVALVELLSLSEAWEKITTCQQCKKNLSPRELKLGFRICDVCVKKNKGKVWGKDSDDVYDEDIRWNDAYTTEADDCGCGTPVKEALSVSKKPISRVVVDYMHGKSGGSMSQTRSVLAVSNLVRPQARSESAVLAYLKKRHPKEDVILLNVDFLDSAGKLIGESVHRLEEAEYEGRTVTLNDPFRTPDGPKKFAVYVKNENGNVIKLGFGDPNLSIKRDDPERRKNFRARHNCDNPGPKWKARYWSCQWGWGSKPLDESGKPTAKKISERATLIAVPKNPHSGDGKGFWKIGNDVYRADVTGAMDVYGHPMDKRWESSYDHFVRYWNGVHARHYTKVK